MEPSSQLGTHPQGSLRRQPSQRVTPTQWSPGTHPSHSLHEASLQKQGLALSFRWEPFPSNCGPSPSMGHAMGATALVGYGCPAESHRHGGAGANSSSGKQFEAKIAHGFPACTTTSPSPWQWHYQQELQSPLVLGALLQAGSGGTVGTLPGRVNCRSRTPLHSCLGL